MAQPIEISEEKKKELQELLKDSSYGDNKSFVIFTMYNKCQHCKITKPIYAKLSQEFSSIDIPFLEFVYGNKIAEIYGIGKFPTIYYLPKGLINPELKIEFTGNNTMEDELREFIKNMLGIQKIEDKKEDKNEFRFSKFVVHQPIDFEDYHAKTPLPEPIKAILDDIYQDIDEHIKYRKEYIELFRKTYLYFWTYHIPVFLNNKNRNMYIPSNDDKKFLSYKSAELFKKENPANKSDIIQAEVSDLDDDSLPIFFTSPELSGELKEIVQKMKDIQLLHEKKKDTFAIVFNQYQECVWTIGHNDEDEHDYLTPKEKYESSRQHDFFSSYINAKKFKDVYDADMKIEKNDYENCFIIQCRPEEYDVREMTSIDRLRTFEKIQEKC